jgi:DNA-binding GntR family transcriptional regulator
MGNLIAVDLYIAHRISSGSFTVFLPKHKAVCEAIRRHNAAGACDAMEHLLSEARELMNRHINVLPVNS